MEIKEEFNDIRLVLHKALERLDKVDPIVIQAVYPDKHEILWKVLKTKLNMMQRNIPNYSASASESSGRLQAINYIATMMEDMERDIK